MRFIFPFNIGFILVRSQCTIIADLDRSGIAFKWKGNAFF